MTIKRFRLQNFVKGDEQFFLARAKIHSRQDLSMHQHDYAEIFWVENGSGLHLINDQQIALNPGHIVMIRPDDKHTFTSRLGITIMNLAFPLQTLHYLGNRYFSDSHAYFWTRDKLPFQTLVTPSEIRMISKKAGEIWPYRNSLLYLDSFLLFIFRWIAEQKSIHAEGDIPVWLNNAIHNYSSPDLFKRGTAGFAELCQKNVDHVNRVIRKSFDKTLSDLVTELRMNFAARQLSLTNVPIKIICHDCGLTNLGHFYKAFKSIYHQTPAQYRESGQTIV
jgi:AraC family transcriptional regulator, dual regulator of chb operon